MAMNPFDTVGRPMEILLVEDSLSDARLAIEALRGGPVQHRLTLVCDGLEAMDFLRRQGRFGRAPRPDLILLDLHLPKKDGCELLREIKADDELKRIPVVVLTASTAHEDILVGQNLQVESYMTKPVDVHKFVTVIKELNRYWRADLLLPTSE
jgi:CheY-like chemotaxis protein